MDQKICRLKIVGDLIRDGDKFSDRWVLDPEKEEVYLLSIFPNDDYAIELGIFAKRESDGITLTWTRPTNAGTECDAISSVE